MAERKAEMNTIIVYYSMGGNTAWAAEKIAAATGAKLLRIEPVKQYPDKGMRKFLWGGKAAVMAETPPLKNYVFDASGADKILFGFPVWAGNIAPPIRTFIKNEKVQLQGKEIAAFACQGGSGAEKAFLKLKQCLDIPALAKELILIDPKDRPDKENEEKLQAFCKQLNAETE